MTALQTLFASTVQCFNDDGSLIQSAFGWREQRRNPTLGLKRRIVWVPGDDKGQSKGALSDAGKVVGARSPGGLPRSLGVLQEICTVYCWASEISTPELENAQYAEARELWDAWYRAVYLSARGRFSVVSTQWVTRALERRYGAALRSVLWVESDIVDKPLEASLPLSDIDGGNISEDVTVTSLDHSETL